MSWYAGCEENILEFRLTKVFQGAEEADEDACDGVIDGWHVLIKATDKECIPWVLN